jgi:hypothetical protein
VTTPLPCLNCHTPIPDGGRYCPTCGLDASDPGATERVDVDPGLMAYGRLWAAVGDHYAFEKVLGRGGMGIVFLAKDLVLERPVALKVLPPEFSADSRLVGRFHREARTAAKLDHPGIVPIHAVETTAGFHYFAMKYITGQSVQDLLEGGPVPLEACLRVLQDAAAALGHAHQRGVVHRDIKPGNIMVDQHGGAIVMDFGISKAIQAGTAYTQAGQIVGTPHYMSPEQAKGIDLDGRSDQYSLALVGYQMLTGKVPFDSDSPHVVLLKHISELLPPVVTVRPDVPAHISEALARALAKEPGERFATMEEFAGALAGRPVAARPPALAAGARAPARGRRRLAIGAAVVAVLAVAASLSLMTRGGAGWMFWRTSPSPQDTAAPAPGAGGPALGALATNPVDTTARAPTPVPLGSTPGSMRQPSAPPPAATRTAPAGSMPGRRPPPPASAAPAVAANVGWLTIDSDPYGTVQIDGVDVRDTPLVRHALAPGTYAVRIVRDGYRTWSETITVTAGNTERRRPTLVASP